MCATCRGNAENRDKQRHKYAWYNEFVDAHIVTFDYRGFGDSQCPRVAFQTCTTENALYEDAYEVYEQLTNRTADGGYGIPSSCIVLHGHSLGSAVATRLAHLMTRLGKPVAGVVLEAPMTSIVDVVMSSHLSPISYLPQPLQVCVCVCVCLCLCVCVCVFVCVCVCICVYVYMSCI